jgi:probable rRNA maturation factor
MAPGDLCRVRGRSVKTGSGRFFGSQARKNLPDPILSKLSVIVTDERGRPVPAGGLARWLTRVAPARARGAVGIALVSDARVRALNREYLGHDYPTDVLSFPASDSPRLRSRTEQASFGAASPRSRTGQASFSAASPYLGDIVIARGVARRQAHAVGHDGPTELRVLALHGLLHLLGYDHERDRGTMARVERRLRRKGGLAEGLLDRATLRRGTARR